MVSEMTWPDVPMAINQEQISGYSQLLMLPEEFFFGAPHLWSCPVLCKLVHEIRLIWIN